MRALVGGFPDDADIVKLGANGKFWLDGRHHVFVSTSLGGLQIGLERMDDGLIHVWYHHLLIGHLRVGPMVGRNVTVQPLAPSVANTSPGDTKGDSAGDTAKPPATEASPLGASAWPQEPAEDAVQGDTTGDARTERPPPSDKGALEELARQRM
jgi:hypothetical protein